MESHFINRSGWLRATILGANDGIISTSSLLVGIAAANADRNYIILAALAALVSGSFSMAAGEYVSVSSQSEIEKSDLAREKEELETMPDAELLELANIYEERGLNKELAMQVAIELTNKDALGTHMRDELGVNEMTKAKPIQASGVSALSFVLGGILPLLVAILAPLKEMVAYQYGFAILFLAFSGFVTAKIGGYNILRSMLKICFWGTVAMIATALIGYLFGVKTA